MGVMARYRRMDVLNAMYTTGIVPVFYHPDLEVVTNVARACARGGARLLEFTNRGDFAWEVFRELERFCAKDVPEMITGVGSVVDPGTATLYINNGASFVVGPVLNAEVARACNRRKVPYSPGCGTASEISAAEELGCEIVKIFPGAEVGGPPFVKAVKGPCPWTSIMPTGGRRAHRGVPLRVVQGGGRLRRHRLEPHHEGDPGGEGLGRPREEGRGDARHRAEGPREVAHRPTRGRSRAESAASR